MRSPLQTRYSEQAVLTEGQTQKERSMRRAILLDGSIYVTFVLAAVASGSLTINAELSRGGLLLAVEVIAFITMCRSHRGLFSAFEYGIGKIERVITILISGGLFLAAIFTLFATFERLAHPVVLPTPGMLLAVTVASINLVINLYCAGDFLRVNDQESSLILASQIRSRLVKTFASAVVVLVLIIATWLADPKAASYLDAIGAIFVIAYMTSTGISLLRESLPDLLDRALPEHEQLLLLRVITHHFEDFDSFGSIKSRTSGGRAYIDVDLEFPPQISLIEASDRCATIEREIIVLIPTAIVAVVPHVTPTKLDT